MERDREIEMVHDQVSRVLDGDRPNGDTKGWVSSGAITPSTWSFLFQLHRHLWRATSTNLSLDLISESESEFLSSLSSSGGLLGSEVNKPKPTLRIQNYMAYRRSTIVGVMYCVLAVAIFRITNTQQFNSQLRHFLPPGTTPETVAIQTAVRIWTVVNLVDIILLFTGIILCLVAQHYWYKYQLSQRLFIGAYLCILVLPFVVAFIPFTAVIPISSSIPSPPGRGATDSDSSPGSSSGSNIDLTIPNKYFAGIFLAIQFFLTLFPGAFTFSLAVLRASLNFRSILPQDPTAGLMARTMALVFTPMIWAILTVFVQCLGSLLVFFAVILFCWSPLIFFIRREDLVPPMPPAEAYKKSIKLRYIYISLNFLAFILMIIYLLELRNIGEKILSQVFLTTYILELLVTWYTDYFCTNLFVADLLVSHAAFSRQRELETRQQNPELMEENEKRKDELVYLKGL